MIPYQKVGGRKFAYLILVFAVSSMLLVYNLIDTKSWVEVVKYVSGFYLAANVGHRWVQVSKEQKEEK